MLQIILMEVSYFVTFAPIKFNVRIFSQACSWSYSTSGRNSVNFLPMVYHVMEGLNIVHNVQPC